MQIFGIILKAFLEHLSGKIEPKPETFVKFDMFDTFFNQFWTQNVEHSTKMGGRDSKTDKAKKRTETNGNQRHKAVGGEGGEGGR